jgi:SAM-dependent methyltransferase
MLNGGQCPPYIFVEETDLLDVRPADDFVSHHAPGAASIPVEQLPTRVHELPPVELPVRLFDPESQRAQAAVDFLVTRGHHVSVVKLPPTALSQQGEATARLWRPNPFLVEALARISTIDSSVNPRAIDIACGSGRDAVYLALRGYEVDAVDVLADALDRATDLARRCHVTVNPIQQDLEQNPAPPRDSYDLVTVFRYLHRPFFPMLRELVAPGGFIVYETFHERNLSTAKPPRNPQHLLKDEELRLAFDGFEILIDRDGFERDGRWFSALLARRPHVTPA